MVNTSQIKLVKNDLNDEQLKHFLAQSAIAVDCEMMGLNVMRDRLCLVQMGDANGNVVLVQIAKGQTEAPNLKKLIESDNVLKIFHYARTDVAWFRHWLHIEVRNVFCTKIASKLVRTYSDKHGLKDLCKEITGKEINKTQQSSYWGAEELDRNQQQYAANDVYYLNYIYNTLTGMLERENKMALAKRCFEVVELLAELDTQGYEDVLNH